MPVKQTAKPVPERKARTAKAKAKPKAPAVRKAAVDVPKGAATSAVSAEATLRELARRLRRIELAGLAGQLVRGWREDVDALVQARKRSHAGLQAVVRRQAAQVREAIGEWQTVGKFMARIGPGQSLSHADKLMVATFQLALTDLRELASLAASSQREAFEILQRRIDKNIDDVQRLLPPAAPSA
jgi:phasin family protein